MHEMLDAWSIIRFHDGVLALPVWPAQQTDPAPDGAWRWIDANHRCNCLLWQEQDKACRVEVAAAEIAACKRLLDRYNQRRHDAVEAIDETLLSALAGVRRLPGARLSSETAGAMIDRLSILALKIHHMRLQAGRVEAGGTHRDACVAKLERLTVQRGDLAGCLNALLDEARRGQSYFKVYRQFTMYSDPALNPWLYSPAARPELPGTGAAAP